MLNPSPNVDPLDDLVKHISEKNCIVFVGSVFPASKDNPLGPPGPPLLALELALSLGGQFEDYSLPWIAQYYVDRYDSNALRRFVVDRLDTTRYAPNQIHLMLAQLPFSQIVYTAQDSLMRDAFQKSKVPVNYVLESDELLSQQSEHTLIQPYGSVSNPGSLKLTADERRSTFINRPNLARHLQNEAFRQTPLFLGFAQGDIEFREFYHFLRPQVNNLLQKGQIVQQDINEGDLKYWSERNSAVIQMEPRSFLKKLSAALDLPIPEDEQTVTGLTNEEELTRRERIILEFSQQLGLGSPVESGAQLRPIANGLSTLRQALSDYRKSGKTMSKETASNQNFEARLILQEGNIEWAEGNLNLAREAFEEAIKRDPDLIDAYVSLHHLLVETGEMKEAVDIYHQILQRDKTRAFIPHRYQLLNILGQSTVGVSYHCKDQKRDTEVVVTILRRALSHQTEALARFEKEVRALNSPRICQFIELNSFHARRYVVTEYIEARSLREFIDEIPAEERDISRIFEIINQVQEALMIGERQEIPHLDLRPENILLTRRGAVLSNYGFSRLAHTLRLSGRAIDKQRSEYEAPEQRSDEPGDQRSDVYALGTIMYEMLTGRTPGVGVYKMVSEAHPQAEEALDVLIDHARAFDPGKRFQTIAEMMLETRRVTLTTEYRKIGQYTRIVLAWLSKIYAALLSRRGSWLTMAVILLFIYLGASNANLNSWLRSSVRSLTLFAITSLGTGVLGHAIVRELGRVRGLGSLIASGRGIGASMGLALCALIIHTTKWGTSGGLQAMPGVDFLGYLLMCSANVILLTVVALIVFHVTGWIFEKRWKHYTMGFYSAYLLLFFLLAFLALNKPLFYILSWG